jgi:Tfp pilus assembly protein PilX
LREAITRPLAGERGASVAAVIILLSMMTVLGVVFTSLFSTGVEESAAGVSSTRALYAADAGIEAAIGRLKKTPVSTSWAWNDGYLNKAAGNGTVNVEVLQYQQWVNSTLVASAACEPFESRAITGVTNPARTVYVTLSWSSASDMGLELYDAEVADCADPTASAALIASALTSDMPETIRYRITAVVETTFTYTARVTGTAGDVYTLKISHPDEDNFGSAQQCGAPLSPPYVECDRALISLGKVFNARREVFAGFSR